MGSFPATRHSVVAAISSPNQETRRIAFDALISAYWRPVYKYIRIRWQRDGDDAADLTQEFFARAFENGALGRFDPTRARFRTFLRVCLDGFLSNEDKAARRLKRGGGIAFVSLDFATAEEELIQHRPGATGNAGAIAGADDDTLFRQEWVRALFSDAVAELRAQLESSGKSTHFAVFQRYDLEDHMDARPTYAQLARELAIPATQVTNYLAFARRELRRLVLERLRAVCSSDDEYRLEARDLLGVDVT